jgi:hypothetical protein
MKISMLTISLLLLFTLSSCEYVDKAQKEYDRIKYDYEEYVGPDDRGPKPFTVVYQQDENAKSILIPAQCSANQTPKHIYFGTQADAQRNIFNAIKNLSSYPSAGILKPFWDIRYTNPVSTYIQGSTATHYPNHSTLTGLDARSGTRNVTVGSGLSQVDTAGVVAQSKCVGGVMAAGTTLNLHDSPEQVLTYAGIANTFVYQIHTNNHIRPWKADTKGNLIVQSSFDTPLYHNFEQNIGGSVAFNIFLYNPKIKKHLNYVIGVYAFGEAWQREKAGIRFDPTTNIIHVATVIKDTSWWTTKSPTSKAIQEVFNIAGKTSTDDGKWNDFYRTNISYQNLLAVLNELKKNPPPEVTGQDFGLAPQDWEVTLLAIQYELEEQGGKASVSGSFRGFESYISEDPL